MTIILVKDCPFCHKEQAIEVNRIGYDKWRNGTLIQDAFPELTKFQRELMISGCCQECWDTHMGSM
jgi:hypothetical protein